jgi:transcriptional regulator with XRE-family HTH domain
MNETDLGPEENRAISTAIREELARRRITRATLADQARISLSTLEKALAGQRTFTLATVVRLEEALKKKLRPEVHASAALAPESLGSYARPAVSWIEGDYLTLRPSFSDPSSIYAYRTEIRWSEALSHLAFRESERLDPAFTQEGAVSIPHQSGYIYLVTNKMGQYRLIIVSRPTIGGEMYGILTTLQSGRGAHLVPVSTPIALVPIKSLKIELHFGRIAPGQPRFSDYSAYLQRTLEEPFALLIGK